MSLKTDECELAKRKRIDEELIERKTDVMSLAIVLPKLVSVHHNKSLAFVNIKVSGFGIGSCHGSKDIGNAPKTCEIGTAFVDIYLLKLHSVDVDHSKVVSLFVLIPKNITRRKVFM